MARGRWKIAVAAAALIVIASSALWYFESPIWTLNRMKDAAQARDAEALTAFIDYPALRESLQTELMARIATKAQKDKTGFGALGLAIGSVAIGPMIDGMVTPAALRAAMLANREAKAAPVTPAASALHIPKQPIIVRRNFSEFVVTAKDRPNSGLVFRRHGLSWMLSGVELPPDRSP